MNENNKEPMPKKSCMLTVMFGIETDEEALVVKKVIDEAIKDIEKKRFTFQINET
jgi:hypothetical protein